MNEQKAAVPADHEDAAVQAVHQRLCARANELKSAICALEEAAEEIVELEADVARLRHLAHQLIEDWRQEAQRRRATDYVKSCAEYREEFSWGRVSGLEECADELAALTEPPA